MQTTTAPPSERLFTVDEYYKMARAGILREDDRVELIEGRIVSVATIGPRHAEVLRRLSRLLMMRLPQRAVLSIRSPIRIDSYSEPEPGIAVLQRKGAFAERHPRPEEVHLIVEVAASSLEFDLETKVALYARAGVREVLVVALDPEQVHVFRDPADGRYASHEVIDRGGSLTPAAFEGVELQVEEILGP